MGTGRAREQISRWAKDLLDTTRRNRSLFFRPLKRGTLNLVSPSPERIHEVIASTRPISVYYPPEDDLLDVPWTTEDSLRESRHDQLVSDRTTRSDVERTLRQLDVQTQADLLDRGLESLYVCFGKLKWQEAPTADTSLSPLVFVPVQLKRESARDPYRLVGTEGDSVLNPSLRVLMEQDYGITLPDYNAESAADENLAAILDQVEAAVQSHGWTVENDAVLMRATFHKEAMYRDLLDHMDQVVSHDVVAALADPANVTSTELADESAIPAEDDVDNVAPPEKSHLIRDADASQRRAIAAVLGGSNLVIDGPPGTGKSQTISNLIAELIAAGKSVLFVSEKIAALDVVAKRLRDRGLGDFLLELHSHKVSRREVATELGRSLKSHPTAKPRFTESERQRYRQARTSLSEYATAVNRIRAPLERSVHWVVGRLAQLADVPSVDVPSSVTAELSAEQVAALKVRFEELSRVWEPAERGDMFEWRGLDVTDFGQAARTDLIKTIDELGKRLDDVQARSDGLALAAGMPPPDDLTGVASLIDVCSFVRTQPSTEPMWWSRLNLSAVVARLNEIAAAAQAQSADIAELSRAYSESWSALDPSGFASLTDAVTALDASSPPATAPSTATVDDLKRRGDFLAECQDLAKELSAESPYLSSALGATSPERNINGIGELATIASLADAPNRPEARWTAPVVAMQVRQSIETLTPLVEDYQRRHGQLADHFEPGIYELDLRGLVMRFRDVHRGWRKLLKAYRDDKRVVANVARKRRADQYVRSLLPEALELQQLSTRLDEQESRDKDLLGHFYQPRSSDLTAAREALDRLKKAADVLGDEYDAQQVALQLAGESPYDVDLGSRAQRVVSRIDSWRQTAELAGFEPISLGAMSPDRLAHWASAAARPTEAIRDVMADAATRRHVECDFAGCHADMRLRADIEARDAAMRGAEPEDTSLLGLFSAGFDTDTDEALRGADWVQELHELAGGPLDDHAVAQLHVRSVPLDESNVREALDATGKLIDSVVSRFDDSRREEIRLELVGRFSYATELVENLLATREKIELWERYLRLTQELAADGWDAALTSCASLRLASTDVVSTLEKAMYTAWFDAVAADDQIVGSAFAADLDATVTRFQSLDRQMIDDAAEWVVTRCNERRPTMTIGAAKIIGREAEKKKRHMPVRELLGKAGDVAQAIKPCFMMSPLSVSQFIPADMRFDVVIFDEASQITPADAVNCIYRGAQLVVAGDDNQLPPTSFFDRADSDDSDVYEEGQLEDFESVLKQCKGAAGLPSVPLRWHYRSQHEDLITFSNQRFYGGDLVTYPSARSHATDLGVEAFVVDGVYRRGESRDNPIEAARVVDRVFYHAEAHPDRTVGVVTFSVPQKELIERLIEDRRAERSDLEDWFKADRLDGFFVKNLESVQGDERDIMIFSVGYGPDKFGKLTLGFGPLSTSGGWRRLNVAVTRARQRVEVVSSFRAYELNTSGTKHSGVKELQRYLDYAENGVKALAIDLSQSEGELESPLEESIYSVIRRLGYEVVPQVGTAGYRIDLGVRHPDRPGEFMLGVECDGRAYHSSKVARDRDRLRQEVLEGLGWRLYRIWGPAWYRDRTGQERQLREALENVANGHRRTPERSDTPARVEREHEEVALDGPPRWAGRYEVARIRAGTDLYPHDPGAFGYTIDVVERILKVEAPIHIDFLGRRVAQAFGCKLTAKVRKAVDDAVLTLSRQKKCSRGRDWVWVSRNNPIRVPGDNDDARRDPEHIPPKELDEALFLLLRDARSATDDELVTQVGRLFGVKRISARARRVLEEAILRLQDTRRIEWLDEGRMRVVDH